MSNLSVTIQATGVLVAPGSSATFTVEVANLGSVVDRYRCEIVGIDPAWVTVSPPSIELFPQNGEARRADSPPSTGRFTVSLHPPRVPAATAGPWPIAARVTSEHDATSRRVEETTVAMLPFGSLETDLHPSIAGGRLGAGAIVQVVNQGNRPEAVVLSGTDPAAKIAFEFRPPSANLGPGESLGVAARLSAGGLKLIGGTETRPFKIEVRAAAPDTPAQVLSGTFERRALIPPGLPMAAAVVAGLALAAAAVFGITRPPTEPIADRSNTAPPTAAPAATPSPSAVLTASPSLVVTASPTEPPTPPPTESPSPTPPPLPPDTCISGYVWREAYVGDHVCVTPDQRTQVAQDNAAASARIDPVGAYGPYTCVSGYVWRVARPDDLVCVTPDERTLVAQDNDAASSRIIGP
jgi:hypothetical protein